MGDDDLLRGGNFKNRGSDVTNHLMELKKMNKIYSAILIVTILSIITFALLSSRMIERTRTTNTDLFKDKAKTQSISSVIVISHLNRLNGSIDDIFEIDKNNLDEFLSWFFPCRPFPESEPLIDNKLYLIGEVIIIYNNKKSLYISIPQQSIGGFGFWVEKKYYVSKSSKEKKAYEFEWARMIEKCYKNRKK